MSEEITQKLEDEIVNIKKKSDFDYYLKNCKTEIENQTRKIIEKVQDKSNELMSQLEDIAKQKKEAIASQVEELESHKITVQTVMTSDDNEPKTKETLVSKTIIEDVKQVLEISDYENLIPQFTHNDNFYEVLKVKDIGEIICFDNRYIIDEDDKPITVTKGQSFTVKISKPKMSDEELAATLINSSGEKFAVKINDQGNGQCSATGTCNGEGDWQMKITAGVTQVKGSPVNVKVEKLGLVATIGIGINVTDVALDKDGHILVSQNQDYIFNYNQLTSRLVKEKVNYSKLIRMHQMGDGLILHTVEHQIFKDPEKESNWNVVKCDDKFNEISHFDIIQLKYPVNMDSSFWQGDFKRPMGLSVDKKRNFLYVADEGADCVFKFNFADSKLLDTIGSKGSRIGQMEKPQDVTLTNEGHVIVADTGNNRIQIFNDNGKAKILVKMGEEDGEVVSPCGVAIDMDGNIIVSSVNKLQLFHENGIFIKRIDHEDDRIFHPAGISVISNRPRRVVVANSGAKNLKIFNY